MRKLVISMHVSLDGFAAGPAGEMDWIKVDDEMFDFINPITQDADAALYGRVTWQMMDGYWPTAGDQPGASKHDREHSAWYNAVDKIVLSRSMAGQSKSKTVFVGGDLSKEIQQIKQQSGKNILVFGSPAAVRSLMDKDLIDEYWLFVNPVILGKGISMFSGPDERIELTLSQTKSFPNGVTALHYIK